MSTKNQNDGSNPSSIEEGLSEEQRSALESRRRFVRNTLMAGGMLAASSVLTNTGVRPAFAQASVTPIPALSGAGLAVLGAAIGGGVLIAKNKLHTKSPKIADNPEGADNSE